MKTRIRVAILVEIIHTQILRGVLESFVPMDKRTIDMNTGLSLTGPGSQKELADIDKGQILHMRKP